MPPHFAWERIKCQIHRASLEPFQSLKKTVGFTGFFYLYCFFYICFATDTVDPICFWNVKCIPWTVFLPKTLSYYRVTFQPQSVKTILQVVELWGFSWFPWPMQIHLHSLSLQLHIISMTKIKLKKRYYCLKHW